MVISLKTLSLSSNKTTLKIIPKEKTARICWNSNGWIKPSGKSTKSKNIKSFENQTGYGLEEWLLDTSKVINGYHYSFLQPINKGWRIHQNKIYNISLYSIDPKTKYKWFIGEIDNIKIITREEADDIKLIYEKNGWLNEMLFQLMDVGVKPENMLIDFNIKFNLNDLKLFSDPIKISDNDKSITSYYYVLLDYPIEPVLDISIDKKFNFKSGLIERTNKPRIVYSTRSYEIESLHYDMTKFIYKQLAEKYGENNVGTDKNTGYGTQVDICVRNNNNFIFYELKTYNTAKKCIREAFGQIMEYAFYPGKQVAKKIIIVSQNGVDEGIINYLKFLRKTFNLPLYYMQYDVNNSKLIEKEY